MLIKPQKEVKTEVKCMLCNRKHPTHHCFDTKKICDNVLKAPPNFYEKHCSKIYDLCYKNKYYIVNSYNTKKLNLTCGKPDHGFKHFLLFPIESCRKASEFYWKK